MTGHELRGVRLGDVYRDKEGDLWEVVGLCDQPQATIRKVGPPEYQHQEQHVIGCPIWEAKWKSGPLREGLAE